MTQDANERSKTDSTDLPDVTIDSAALFKDRKLILIRHNGECYRLAITKTGKLILTK